MTLNQQLSKAIIIAIEAHNGQEDVNGQPYIAHPMRVMSAAHKLTEKIVGVLHDVVEDSDWTLEDLVHEGFSKEIIDGIDAMTKRDGEEYKSYLQRLQSNPLAVRVKLNDLTDNMDMRRLNELSDKDVARMRKYLKAYHLLTNA